MKFRLGIIGTGVMAGAITNCLLDKGVLPSSQICAYDIDSVKLEQFSKKGITPYVNLQEMLFNADMIMLSVKPQNFKEILSSNDFTKISTLTSIMAGVKISVLSSYLSNTTGIARVMPNLPCAVGCGYSGICFHNVKDEDKLLITEIFSACGKYGIIEEAKFDSLTSISGSGPAYVYMFIDAMIKGGIDGGLTYNEAREMAVSTVLGAAKMTQTTEDGLQTMIERVCSKGGTTIEAIKVFKNEGLEDIIRKGIAACKKRSAELSGN